MRKQPKRKPVQDFSVPGIAKDPVSRRLTDAEIEALREHKRRSIAYMREHWAEVFGEDVKPESTDSD